MLGIAFLSLRLLCVVSLICRIGISRICSKRACRVQDCHVFHVVRPQIVVDAAQVLAYLASAEFVHLAYETVKEFAVVAYDDGCSVEGEYCLLKHLFRWNVEMIGRLVEDEQIDGFEQQLYHCQSAAFASREHLHLLVHILATEHERAKYVLYLQSDVALCHIVNGLKHGQFAVEQLRLVLGKVAYLHVVSNLQVAVERDLAHNTLHER